MRRFAVALMAHMNVPVSEREDPEKRKWFEEMKIPFSLRTSASPLVIWAHSAEEANQRAVSSDIIPVKDGWYGHKACSTEIL